MRLYQLARELAVPFRALLDEAEKHGYGVASHLSLLQDDEVDRLRRSFASNGRSAAPEADAPVAVVAEVEETDDAVATAVAETPDSVETLPPMTTDDDSDKPARPADRRRGAPIKREPDESPSQPKRRIQKKVVKIVKRKERSRGRKAAASDTSDAPPRVVEVTPPISLRDFSQLAGIKSSDIISKLMRSGVFMKINAILDAETVEFLGLEFGREIVMRKPKDLEEEVREMMAEDVADESAMVSRPPIVTFLGHVDHGKTSLMDAIRKTNVTAGESGGITQHIGAYKVRTEAGHEIVFLDTPGHEAFTAMRARGANVTDIAVLVVAADDGVMPQTAEAIAHAKAAGVPIVTAINKCDKADANPTRVKQQLATHGVQAEDWGGDAIMVECSATTGDGVDDLLEMLALQAEVLELKASPAARARGTVLEARVTEGRGVVATVLVQNGTLHRGDVMLCGRGEGKVRMIRNDLDEVIEEAGPATPVTVTGLSRTPEAGDKFFVVGDASQAKALSEARERRARDKSLAEKQRVSLDDLFDRLQQGEVETVRLIVKADVQGSVEAIRSKLESLGLTEVKVEVLHSAVGGVTESDVSLADASNAIILGFHVTVEERARALAAERGVEIRLYQVIYDLVNDVHDAMERRLAPERRESILGHA